MTLKKAAPLLVLGGLAYVFTQGNKKAAPPPIIHSDNAPIDTSHSGLQTAGNSTGMVAVSGVDVSSSPDYKQWTRKHWAAWCQLLLKNNSLEDVKTIIWAAWRNQENEFSDKYPTVEPLFYSLVSYQINNAVGNLSIDENSQPVYDTWGGWINNVTVWECPDWKNWFDKMAAAWGDQTAIQKFSSAWSFADNWSLGSNGWSCSQTCNFIDEMQQRGVDVADTGMRTICNLTTIPYNLVTAGATVSQGVNTAANTAASVAPLIIYGGVIFLAVKAYQSVKQ